MPLRSSGWPVELVYTVDEVADLLGLSRGLTYELVRAGTIPAKRKGVPCQVEADATRGTYVDPHAGRRILLRNYAEGWVGCRPHGEGEHRRMHPLDPADACAASLG